MKKGCIFRIEACSRKECDKCKNSEHRPCEDGNYFKASYVQEKEPIQANCGGIIQIELYDRRTGQLVPISLTLRAHVVDGEWYDKKFPITRYEECNIEDPLQEIIREEVKPIDYFVYFVHCLGFSNPCDVLYYTLYLQQ